MSTTTARIMRLPIAAVMALATTLASATPTLGDLRWITEEYAPINFSDEHGVATGITVDLLHAMMERLDHPLDPATIQVLPWARGYRIAQEQVGTCLFGTTITDSRRELFEFIAPAVENRVAVVAPRAASLSIDSAEALTPLRIGVVREDIGELLLQEANVGAQLVRVDSARALVRMLAAGRFDAIAYSEPVTHWTMQANDIDPNTFETVYTLREGIMGYACHPATEPALLQQLQQSLDSLIEDGTAARIRLRYTR